VIHPIDQTTLSALIGDIYDCALNADRWLPTLERLASVMGGCNGTILSHGVDSVSFQYAWGTPPEALRAYAEQFARIDPLLTIGWHFDVDDPVSMERFISPNELMATAFYRGFLAPLDWYDFTAVILEKSATRSSTIGFTRTTTLGSPGEREKSLLKLLAPHIRRAVIFHGMKERDAARATDLGAALDLMQVPVLLLDSAGQPVETNAAAEKFLRETASGTLRDSALLALTQPVADVTSAQPMSSALTLPDGRRFAAHTLPLTLGLRDRMGNAPRATSALFIQQIGDLQPLPGEVLVKLYGLTPAETRLIALLGQDFTLEDAAATLGIALPTARTHLQRIFQKTNTNRQSQVVKLVLSALPRPPD